MYGTGHDDQRSDRYVCRSSFTNAAATLPETAPKRFTKRTRMAIRIWKRSGLAGIAFLTPLILTPIGGTILALSFGVKRGQVVLYMLVSALVWAIVQTLAFYQIPGLKGMFN